MIQIRESAANQLKLRQMSEAWRQLLAETLRPGFHGMAALEVHIQDGVVQNFRRKVERLEK